MPDEPAELYAPTPNTIPASTRGIEGMFENADLAMRNEPKTNDAVNHPSHYTAYKGLEIIELTEQMNFNRGNAVKYIARAGLKNKDTEIEDLRKARWYIEREIRRLRD